MAVSSHNVRGRFFFALLVTLPVGVVRREPIALMLGVGFLTLLVAGAIVSFARVLLRRDYTPTLRFDNSVIVRDTPTGFLVTFDAGRAPRESLVSFAVRSSVREYRLQVRCESAKSGNTRHRFVRPGYARGVYRPEDIVFTVPDPIGLTSVSAKYRVEGDMTMRVLPRARPVAAAGDFRGRGEHDRVLDSVRPRDGDRLDVRPYVPGDDTSRINWNVYAHTGELFLRIPEELPPPVRAICLVVDGAQPEEAVLDGVIEATLGLAGHFGARDYHLEIAVLERDDTVKHLGGLDLARFTLAGLDHLHGLPRRAGVPNRKGIGRILVTSGASRRCPAALRGEWIVLIQEGEQTSAGHRLARLDRNG